MDAASEHSLIEALTERELEVLALLAEGLSNKAIAEALVVEVSTVKWYNNQIYGKLQVANRAQAVIRARTLDLLDSDDGDILLRPQHNLPADTLPFIGREREIESLVQQLSNDKLRLMTLLGPGGMGKTRLVIQAGRRLLGHFSDGVYFVPLASLSAVDQTVTATGEAVGLRFHRDEEPRQQLLGHLQSRQLLLIFDNVEHLIDDISLLTDILRSAPRVRLLTTSREKLNLVGESVFHVGGLSTPDENDLAAPLSFDAVALFVEVAQRAARPVEVDDLPLVGRICRLLDGMPLAILLAAAWLDTLPLAEIEAEIQRDLAILDMPLRDLPSRHQSIMAVFAYSWQRLSEQEQRVFMHLTAFRDGFSREAAQSVARASLRDLQRLVHTSFVQQLPYGRYSIHNLVRQYGEARLNASGERDALRERHAAYYAEVIRPLSEAVFGSFTEAMLAPVRIDYENIRAAWLYHADRRNTDQLRRFMDGLCMFYDCYNRNQEGIELFEPLLELFDGGGEDEHLFQGQLLVRLAWCYGEIGELQRVLELAAQSMDILERYGATEDLIMLNQQLVPVNVRMDDFLAAAACADAAFQLAREVPDSKWGIAAKIWYHLSYLANGDVEAALRWQEAQPENTWRTFLLGLTLRDMGEFARSEAILLEGLERHWLSRVHYVLFYNGLSDCLRQAGDYDKAWRYLQRGLPYGDANYYSWCTLELLLTAVMLHMDEQDYMAAVALAANILHNPFVTLSVSNAITDLKDDLAQQMPASEFNAAYERGQQRDLSDLISEYMER